MTTEAEIIAMNPHAREGQGLLATAGAKRRAKTRVLSRVFKENMALVTP